MHIWCLREYFDYIHYEVIMINVANCSYYDIQNSCYGIVSVYKIIENS